jgi:phosphate transport system ATP-binding protein
MRAQQVRLRIGMVFQKPNPFPAMSVRDNVLSGLKLARIKCSDKDALVEQSLERASLWREVRDRLHSPGGALSGGQQQRLCIARSLAVQPNVLLMDEPCSALDPTSTGRIEETIAELRGEVTVVIVTHNMQQAHRVSDVCAFFLAAENEPGRIVEQGPTDKMFSAPDDPRTLAYVQGRFG